MAHIFLIQDKLNTPNPGLDQIWPEELFKNVNLHYKTLNSQKWLHSLTYIKEYKSTHLSS